MTKHTFFAFSLVLSLAGCVQPVLVTTPEPVASQVEKAVYETSKHEVAETLPAAVFESDDIRQNARPICQLSEADAQKYIGHPTGTLEEKMQKESPGCIAHIDDNPFDPTASTVTNLNRFTRVQWLNRMFYVSTEVKDNALVVKSITKNVCPSDTPNCGYLVGSARGEDAVIHSSCNLEPKQVSRYINRLKLDVETAMETFYPNCETKFVTSSKVVSTANHPDKPDALPKASDYLNNKTVIIENWRTPNPATMDWDAYYVESIKFVSCKNNAQACRLRDATVTTVASRKVLTIQ